MGKKLGIYLHIPFCIKKCAYCDFCSYPGSADGVMRRYSDELCRRIESLEIAPEEVDTVYFGGGTPTLLPTECFENIMRALNDRFNILKDAEITAECNPASITNDGLLALRQTGINRLSMGLQSANDNELLALDRVHSFKDFCVTFEEARAAGFDNISADLMYGIPEQTLKSFKRTLRALVSLAPEHISAYGLKIEEGTAFHRMYDSLTLPDEDAEYEMYSMCCSLLKENGYGRYEISNFAKPGKQSRHNLRYWHLDDYIGFGVAAHSCFGGRRWGNSRDIDAFLRGEDITEEHYAISNDDRVWEYVMLGLRLEEGVSESKFKELSGKDLRSVFSTVDKMTALGFIESENGAYRFTTKGFFVSNAILSDMLADFDKMIKTKGDNENGRE